MIIWIASYPKSGNTWVRSLLSSYLYSSNGTFNFDLLLKIQKFPSELFLEPFLKDFTDPKKVSKYWIPSQDKINLGNDNIFLKTHSALCTFENNSFTNKRNTKAAIYIVRDPRNVITSLSHHNSLSISDAFTFLTNSNQIIAKEQWGGREFGMATVLGSWSDHYKSWRDINFASILIVRYEDLINDIKKTFVSILNFLSNQMEIMIDEKKIVNTIDSCRFDVLSNKEKKEGFVESVAHKESGKKLKFFNLGKENNWKKLLNQRIEEQIRFKFSKEMKELGYI